VTGLTRLAVSKRSVTLLLAVALFGAGVYAWGGLRQELVPDVEFPVLTIVAAYPGAGANDVTEQVTKPIEAAIGSTSRLDSLQSTSANSLSVVIAQFTFGTDIKETRAAVEQAIGSTALPEGVEPRVIVQNINAQPVIIASITPVGETTLEDAASLTRTALAPDLQGVEGVSGVDVTGGAERRVRITLDPAKLTAAGISLQQIQGVLRANDITFPVGQITIDGTTVPVSALHRFESIEELEALVVGVHVPALQDPARRVAFVPRWPPGPVALGSLGRIELVEVATTGYSRTDGVPSISLQVQKTSDANTVAVAAAVQDRLAGLADEYAGRLEIRPLVDLSTFITESRDGLLREGGLGAVFAVVVIFLFLLNLRSTVVAAVSIPLSLVAALALMLVAGISVNIMTLGGLAVAVGRVVDDSIVVLENIYRHRGRGDDMATAVIDGTREVASAITSSTLTTVAVFLPLGFVGGLISQFFLPFALTVTFALIASLIVALTVVPVLATLLLRTVKLNLDEHGEPRRTIWQRAYEPVLRLALRSRLTRWGTIGLAAALFVLTSGLVADLPTQFINSGSEKYLIVTVVPPSGAATDDVTARAAEVEAILLADDEVRYIQTTIPGEGDTSFQTLVSARTGRPANSASMFVRLDDAAELRASADRLTETLAPIVADPWSVSIEENSGFGGASLNVVVSGTDADRIASGSEAVADALAGITELVNVNSDLARSSPEIQVRVDPNKALLLGSSTAQIAGDLRTVLVGGPVGRVVLDEQPLTVDLRIDGAGSLTSLGALKRLPVGIVGTAPLGSVADVSLVVAQGRVTRVDEAEAATISATIRSQDQGAVAVAVGAAIDGLRDAGDLEGVAVSIGGVTAQQSEAFAGLFAAMAVAILLVYVVMVLVFDSLVDPLVIMFSLPLATIGAFPLLAVTGRPIGISALIGFLMLIGIVVTNAIVLLDLVEQLRHKGMSTDRALIAAGRTRVRPILMTAVATIIALFPLALGLNEGSIIAAELGTVVIGGLLSSTVLTLVVVPVVYSLIDGAKVWVRRRLGGQHGEHPTAHEAA